MCHGEARLGTFDMRHIVISFKGISGFRRIDSIQDQDLQYEDYERFC